MAGFVKFDPDDWDGGDPAKVAKAAKVDGTLAGLAGLAALAPELAEGVRRLLSLSVPRNIDADAWPAVISDARRLVADGWVLQAIKLGWSALDLFGAVANKRGDPSADGLAVRLNGRDLLAICASFATVRDTAGGRSYLYRGNNAGSKLLWELGRRG